MLAVIFKINALSDSDVLWSLVKMHYIIALRKTVINKRAAGQTSPLDCRGLGFRISPPAQFLGTALTLNLPAIRDLPCR